MHLREGHPFGIVLVGLFCEGEASVDEEVVVLDVAGLACDGVAVADTIEFAVSHQDVVNVCVFIETDYLYAVLRLLAGDVFHVDIAQSTVDRL